MVEVTLDIYDGALVMTIYQWLHFSEKQEKEIL
jgi:hypothetical protein